MILGGFMWYRYSDHLLVNFVDCASRLGWIARQAQGSILFRKNTLRPVHHYCSCCFVKVRSKGYKRAREGSPSVRACVWKVGWIPLRAQKVTATVVSVNTKKTEGVGRKSSVGGGSRSVLVFWWRRGCRVTNPVLDTAFPSEDGALNAIDPDVTVRGVMASDRDRCQGHFLTSRPA